MNSETQRAVEYLKKELKQTIENRKELQNKIYSLETALFKTCPHEDVEISYDFTDRYEVCKQCGLDIAYMK